MKTPYILFLVLLSLFTVESYIKPLFVHKKPLLRPGMCKHNFADFSNNITIADKYFLIHSLTNHIVLNKQDLLFDYCYKNLNYTDIMHVVISPALESVIRSNYDKNTTLELYDTIKTKSLNDDCSISIFRLNDYKVIDM